MEEENKRTTFKEDLLGSGVKGKLYDLSGTGSSFRPDDIKYSDFDKEVRVFGLGLSKQSTGSGESKNYPFDYLLDKKRDLEHERRLKEKRRITPAECPFIRGEKVVFITDNKVYDFGYMGREGHAIIYEEGECNAQDSIAVDLGLLKKLEE